MVSEGKLVRSDDLFDKEIFGFTPFGKRWVYNPKAVPTESTSTEQKSRADNRSARPENNLPTGMTDTYMQSALKLNGFEDTPENRAKVVDAWQNR